MPVELDATGNGDGQDEDGSSPKMGLRGVGLHRQRPRKAAVKAVLSTHHDHGMGLRFGLRKWTINILMYLPRLTCFHLARCRFLFEMASIRP